MYPTKLSCLIYSLLEVVSMCQELSAVDHRLTQMASLLQSFGASFLRSELMNHPVYLQSGLGATTCLHICISRNLKGWGQWVLQKLLFCTRLRGIAFPSSRKSFLISVIMPHIQFAPHCFSYERMVLSSRAVLCPCRRYSLGTGVLRWAST